MNNKGNINLPITYDQLTVGYEFPQASYELSASAVANYLRGVGQQGAIAVEFVPPLAITACTIATMSESMEFTSGVIHASQDLEFYKLVPVGSVIQCQSRVAGKVDRGKMHMLTIEYNAFNKDKEKVQSGKATLVLSD